MRLQRLVVLAAAIILPATAQAQHTITFEGAGCNPAGPGYFASVQSGYESFNWSNVYSFNMQAPECAANVNYFVGAPPSGIYNGVHGGQWDAYDAGCCIAVDMSRPSDPFNVMGLWATSEFLTGMQLRVIGFGPGGSLLYNNIFSVNANVPTYLDLEYTGIEDLSISWVIGTGIDAHGQSATSRFAVDDIVVSGHGIVNDTETTTPEPASLVLMVTGLAAVGGVAVRRRALGILARLLLTCVSSPSLRRTH